VLRDGRQGQLFLRNPPCGRESSRPTKVRGYSETLALRLTGGFWRAALPTRTHPFVVDGASLIAYHFGMPGAEVRLTLVFTVASLEHLAERHIEAADVVDAVYGRHGQARLRRAGRGARQRWFVTAPLEGGELLTCVFRAVLARDLETSGVFVISNGEREDAPAGLIRRCACASALGCPMRMKFAAIADGVDAREGTDAYGDTEEG